MKKILQIILLSLFAANFGFAQSYTEVQDSLFQNLDKTKIPTDVLYDRVFSWANLTLPQSADIPVSYSMEKQAWLELELASYSKRNLLSIKDAKNIVTQNKLDGKGVSIGYIDYDFNSIDSTALDRGALFFGEDSLLYDGEGDAYLTHRTTLPFVSTESVFGTDISFYFDPSLYLNNTGRQIEKIEVDLNTGEPLVLLPGAEGNLNIDGIMDSLISVSLNLYFVGSSHPETFVLEWRNGNMVPMGMSFDDDKCTSGNPILFSSGSSLTFKGYDEGIASQGKGEYVIFYRQINGSWVNCATDVRKPVIIIDGFDPGDDRKITFFEGKPGIWDLLKYKNGTKHLGDELRKKGYDVIVLNFPKYKIGTVFSIHRDGGADYIERNAMVLAKLIQEVNAKLIASGSTEEIVIVGPSMGGQVARFALAYMEKQQSLSVDNMNHNTRLYVSFDSPHKGANIPIAAQQALFHLGVYANQGKALESYQNQIRSKAGRQLLIEQMDGLNKTASFFQTYYNNLNTNGLTNSGGWPLNLRKVALINGTAKGINTNFANQRILHVKANAALIMKGIELDLYNMPNFGNSLKTYDGMVRNGDWGLG